MADRIVRDGWLTSPCIQKLDIWEERFFLRLMLIADDWGRASAAPEFLKKACFPLEPGLRGADVGRWLDALEKAGLIRRYCGADGKGRSCDSRQGVFLEICRFKQRIRHVRSKLPAPPWSAQKNKSASKKVTVQTAEKSPENNPMERASASQSRVAEVTPDTSQTKVTETTEMEKTIPSINTNPIAEEPVFSGEINPEEIASPPATMPQASAGYPLEEGSVPDRVCRTRRARRERRTRAEIRARQQAAKGWSPTLCAKWKQWVGHLEVLRGPLRTSPMTFEAQRRHLSDILQRRGEAAALDALEWPMRNGRTVPIEPPVKKRSQAYSRPSPQRPKRTPEDY